LTVQALALKQESDQEWTSKIRKLQAEKQALQASLDQLNKHLAFLEAERARNALGSKIPIDKNAGQRVSG